MSPMRPIRLRDPLSVIMESEPPQTQTVTPSPIVASWAMPTPAVAREGTQTLTPASVISSWAIPAPSLGLPSVVALSAGPITQGMVFLDGQVAEAVQVSNITTQTYVLSRYASNNVKHAAVSWVSPGAGTYALASIDDPGGSYTPTNPSASVAFVIDSTTWTATLPSFNAANTRFNGAVCRECRYITTPMNGETPHDFLTVIFDVRSYAEGGHRVDIQCGTTKDVAENAELLYNLTITVAGSSVYTRSRMQHCCYQRWRKIAYVSLTEGAVTDDTSALEALKAVPTYIDTMNSPSYTFPASNSYWTNGGPGFDLLRTGVVSPNFGDTGGREDIGLFPRWTAAYLHHKTANQKEMMLRSADLSGSWPTNLTVGSSDDPEDIISIDTNPYYQMARPAAGGYGPANDNASNDYEGLKMHGNADDECPTHHVALSETGHCPQWPADDDPYIWYVNQNPDKAHQPNLNYVPWLLTADKWYEDQLCFWANWNMLSTAWLLNSSCRNGSYGSLAAEQQRGWAWGVRAIAQAGKWLSDAHPYKSYFAEKAQHNLNWCDDYDPTWTCGGLDHATHPLGIYGQTDPLYNLIWNQGQTLYPEQKAVLQAAGYTDCQGLDIFASWQYCFMSLTIMHMHHLGYTGGLGAMDALLGTIHNLFTHYPDDIPRAHAMMYWPSCSYNTSTGKVLLASWYDVHHISALYWGDDQSAPSNGCPTFTPGGYGNMGRAALMLGQSRGLDNTDSISFLMDYVNPYDQTTMVDHTDGEPEWAFTSEFLSL